MNKVPEKYIMADARIKKLVVKKLLTLLYLIVSPMEITAHIINRIYEVPTESESKPRFLMTKFSKITADKKMNVEIATIIFLCSLLIKLEKIEIKILNSTTVKIWAAVNSDPNINFEAGLKNISVKNS